LGSLPLALILSLVAVITGRGRGSGIAGLLLSLLALFLMAGIPILLNC
jgi:hypothetical protein